MSDRSGRSGGSSRRVDSAHPARPLSLTPISGQSPVRADGAFRRLGGHVSRLAKWLGRTSAPPRVDRVVVGLGNPGDGYANTRHNVGFQVASRLAKRARADFAVKAAESRIAEGAIDGVRLAIARPQTFMNESGRAVRKLLDRYRSYPPPRGSGASSRSPNEANVIASSRDGSKLARASSLPRPPREAAPSPGPRSSHRVGATWRSSPRVRTARVAGAPSLRDGWAT